MSVDHRLRTGLARNAASLEPEVERRLSAVRAQDRRRRAVRWSAGLAVAAASTAAALVLLEGPGGGTPDPLRPVHTPSGSATPQRALLTGEYAGRLAGPGDLAGRWVLRFDAAGTLQVTAPATYDGVLSGVLFEATDEFRTNLFQQDTCVDQGLGRYAWQRSGPTLTFAVLDDPCDSRVRLLDGVRWQEVR